MTPDEDPTWEDVEEQSNRSWVLGKVGLMEDLGTEFHRRSGEAYASDRFDEARFLKDIAKEFTKRGEKMRREWNEEYNTPEDA